ncbi:DUF3140 domain-containing protein [Streptomyces sp. NPDC015492]|uniref:DUF3140 domain-containing protein n=1 Tax=unclassified Streptomyces TaxID=2593676 RepID=UPI0036CFC166
MAHDKDETWDSFRESVNMPPAELERWLATSTSKDAGEHEGGHESTGHASGRRIVEILRKTKSDLTDADYQHMAKVNGYIHRHLAQRPSGDVQDTTWRHSLMNWGHDPMAD